MLASFAEFGFVQGNWNARIPSVKNARGVGLDTLGFLLLPVGVGALVAMSATGWILRRWSSTRLRRVACVASCAALLAAAWTTVHWQLAVLLAVVGAGWGAWDVTINVQGATVERRTGGVLLPAMHGAWGWACSLEHSPARHSPLRESR